jgi:hypothetical protein
MDRYKELYYKLYKQKREQQKIDEIIAFLKVTQSPKNEIQKDIFKVKIH